MLVSLGPHIYFLVGWIVISICVIENCRQKSQNFNNKIKTEEREMKINDNISKILYTFREWEKISVDIQLVFFIIGVVFVRVLFSQQVCLLLFSLSLALFSTAQTVKIQYV